MSSMATASIAELSSAGRKAQKAGNLVLVVKEGQCGCGCGGSPTGKKAKYRQGHDATLRHKLIAAHLAGVGVEVYNGKTTAVSTATVALGYHGWDAPDPSKKRAHRATSKSSAKKSTAKKSTAKKSTAKRKLKPVPDPAFD